MNTKAFNIKKMFIIVTIISLISKLLGLGRDMIISSYVGFGENTDGILLAISIPTTLSSIFQTTIRTTFAPLFSEKKKSNNKKFNNVKNQIIILLVIYTLFFYYTSDFFVKMIAPGLSPEIFLATSDLVSMTGVLIFLYGLFYIFNGYLQSLEIFSVAEVAGVLNNIIIIVTIFLLYPKYENKTIIYGYILGAMLQVLYSYYLLKRKTDYKFITTIEISASESQEFYRMAKYVLLSSFLAQITFFTDKIAASFLEAGSISALNYAGIIKNTFITLFLGTISSMLFPSLSKSFKKNAKVFKETLDKQLLIFTWISVYLTLIIYMNSNDIVRILFDRGKFTENGVIMTTEVLKIYSLGIIFWSFRETLLKAFYSARDTKTPVLISAVSLSINFGFNFLFAYFWGYRGIALSTNLSLIVNGYILYVLLKKKYEYKLNVGIKNKILLLLCLSTPCSLLINMYIKKIFESPFGNLVVKSVIITIVYVCLLMIVFKNEIVGMIKNER